MGRVIFARHGESTANLTRTFANRTEAFALSETGRRQARELAARLRSPEITTLLSSPLLRARETADIVGNILGLEPHIEPALCEWDVGRWEGTASAQGWAEYEAVTQAWVAGDHAAAVGGGESLDDIRARTEDFLASLRSAAATENIVCIGHGGLYRAALPGRLVNVTYELAFAQPFPNSGWVVAHQRDAELRCVEWCGLVMR